MRQKGFTIVELIIVTAVIGILAAIALVSYSGVTNRANDAAVQSDLDAISGQLEAYRVHPNNSNKFPDSLAALNGLGVKVTKTSYKTTINRNLIYCLDDSGADAYQAYKVIVQSKSGNIFMMTQDGFASHSLIESDLSDGLCATQGMVLISSGMYQPDNWQAWVGG